MDQTQSRPTDEPGVRPGEACRTGTGTNRRVLFVSHGCYLEASNGASVASRSLMDCLARHGFAAEALSGTVLDSGGYDDPAAWLTEHGLSFELGAETSATADPAGSTTEDPASYRLRVGDVTVVLHRCPTMRPHEPDEPERRSFLRLHKKTMVRFRPDIVVSYGGDALAVQVRRQARAMGAAVVCPLHHLLYRDPAPFAEWDAVIVPSRFAAGYYRANLGLEAAVLPNLVDVNRARAAARDPRYVTFVNPSHEKGVYAFARIADELGRRRPDIPLLVVEGRGTERTLVDCGLDLRSRGNVSVMAHTPDPRHFWGATRIALMPSLCWESQGLVAVEAMINGIPVIASDRGALPETLGDAGIILGLPPRLTPSTRELPTAREVEPWVKAIIGLWDDPNWYGEQSRRAAQESRRWSPEMLEPQYVRFFEGLRPAVDGGG